MPTKQYFVPLPILSKALISKEKLFLMSDQLEPIACCIATHTINCLEPVLEKYNKLTYLTDTSIKETLTQGKAAILRTRSFNFYKTLNNAEFNERLTIYDIKDQLLKIVDLRLEGKDVSYTLDDIIIEDKKFCHDDYNEFFEDQDYFVEYICLAVLSNQFEHRNNTSANINGKVYISLQTACKTSGFKPRQVREYAKSFGITIFDNASTGQSIIERDDFENLHLKSKTIGLEYLF